MKQKKKAMKKKAGKGSGSSIKKKKPAPKMKKPAMKKQKSRVKKIKAQAKKSATKQMKNASKKKLAKPKYSVSKKVLKMKAKTFQIKKPAQQKKQLPAASAKKAGAQAAKKPAIPLVEKKPKVLVLSGFGLNSEVELAHAFSLAGAEASIVHFSDISSGAVKLEAYQIFAIPGGWAYGDDIAGGKVLANKLKTTFRQQFEQFVSSGKPIIGVCNGFQVLVKLGALPNLGLASSQEATLERNASGKFEDRWVYLKPQKSVCKYFEGVDFIQCPVRHGEGRFIAKDETVLQQLEKKGFVVVKYADEKLSDSAPYPQNPNGSPRGIAGICDSTGKIFGLMPHPECSVRKHTFPRWTAGISHEKNSLRFFENIVKEGKKFV